MKKFLLGTVGLIAMAGSASAADIAPYKAPPVYVSPGYDWTGFYVGGNGGWGSSHHCWDNLTFTGTFFAHEGCQ